MLTSQVWGTIDSAGFGVSLSTVSGSNGYKPLFAQSARMVFWLNAFNLAGQYRAVKCSFRFCLLLLALFVQPARDRRSSEEQGSHGAGAYKKCGKEGGTG